MGWEVRAWATFPVRHTNPFRNSSNGYKVPLQTTPFLASVNTIEHTVV
jgi:hypothetical protein